MADSSGERGMERSRAPVAPNTGSRRRGTMRTLLWAVGLWIGGFDLIYACQDAEVDRQIGVHSVPARFGVAFALRLSAAVHVVTFGLFVWFGVLVGLGWLWWIGLALAGAAFVYEHAIVTANDLSRVNRAFFTANGFVGIALFVFALSDLVIRLGLRP